MDKKFERLTVLEVYKIKGSYARAKAICDCGILKEYRLDHILRGGTKSCGCLRNERLREKLVKHGMAKTAEYRCYHKILERCLDENYKEYHYYGGRGIMVCNEWIESFENFIADMGKRPSNQHSIDRIDVNGNYDPKN
jgi:hypothetical protein